MTDTLSVTVNQPIPEGLPPDSHVLAILIGFDVLLNAIFGGRAYQTISSRCGESILSGGWASKVKWPAWWINHCIASDYITQV